MIFCRHYTSICQYRPPLFFTFPSYLEQHSLNFIPFLGTSSKPKRSSARNSGSISSEAAHTVAIKRRFCVLLLDFFHFTSFKVSFTEKHLDIPVFLRCLMAITIPSAVRTRDRAEKKFQSQNGSASFISLFSAFEENTLRELGMQQLRQVLKVSLGLHHLRKADERVRDMFHDIFISHN